MKIAAMSEKMMTTPTLPQPALTIEERVSQAANALLDGKNQLKVLEAGCGSASHIRFHAPAHVVGIDISKEQLDKNAAVQEKILGDLQTYPLPQDEFDAAVCWMVMEHLDNPRDAMLNMVRSVKPGGLLVLGFPNLLSLKGLVTKVTPLSFHRLFYILMGYKSRPFPTYLRAAIIPARLMRFAQNHGCSIAFCRLEEGNQTRKVRKRFWLVNVALSAVDSVVRVVTLGRLQLLFDNCYLIVQKDAK